MRIAILGLGTVGSELAARCIAHGQQVTLVDTSSEQLETAPARIRRILGRARLLRPKTYSNAVTILNGAEKDGSVAYRNSWPKELSCDVVFECLPEALHLKRDILSQIGTLVPEALAVTTTSTIRLIDIATSVPRPERLVSMHFMTPVTLIDSLEVVLPAQRDDITTATVEALIASLSLGPFYVRDSPGYVTNRVLMLMINLACVLVDEGVASEADIDAIFCHCLGHKMGPLATAEMIGLATVERSLRVLDNYFPGAGYKPADLISDRLSRRHSSAQLAADRPTETR